MSWISQVSVNTGATADAGWCLWLAEEATGAPHLYPSARAAWDAASDKHADRDYPTDAVVALFWDWTSKSDGVNYGHVVINTPGQGLFSSPKNWGVHGSDFYSSIDEVSNWLGATFLGWTSDLAGLQLSVWDGGAAAPVTPTASNQRIAASLGAKRRAEPSSASENLPGDLEAGELGNFVGWIHGENVSGNDVWFQGVSGNWFWSGSFTDASTDGIADLNPAPVAAPVIDAPPVVDAPVVADVAPATPVEAPVVSAPIVADVAPVAPPVVKPAISAPTKDEVLTAINDTAATADETAKVSTLTLFNPEFWIYSGERVIKSAAYSANGMLVANGAGLLQADWQGILGVAAMAAASSLLVALSSFKDI